MKWYQVVSLTVLVLVGTLFVRVPIPGGGYFNLGDVLIVFSGLYAGSKVGALAGGMGSAIADLMGFPLFAPITIVAKGVEGYLCGLGNRVLRKSDCIAEQPLKSDDITSGSGLLSWLMPALGVLAMVIIYFLGCIVFPNMGLAVAITDLPANLLQAVIGYLGGRAIYAAYQKFLLPL